MDTIANRNSWGGYREYHHPVPSTETAKKWISDWITLEANEFYKVESLHIEYTGSHDHHTVSVEYEKDSIAVNATTNHHHASKEVQILEIDSGMDFETFNITVSASMGGKYQIMFVNPRYDSSNKKSPRTVTSREVTDNASASQVRWAIQDFYGSGYTVGSWVDVKKYETNDAFETVESGATKFVYTAKVMRAIDGPGWSSATIIKNKATTSTIAISALLTNSSPPLAGNFIISCANSDGNAFETREMSIWEDTDLMSLYLSWDIPHLMLKTHVYATTKYAYRQNGMEFVLVFQDLHADPAQCTIKSGTTTALTGGKTIAYTGTTSRAHGKNLMFEPVPLEMLYHDATKPQVLVKINGFEAICPTFNCDYLYKAATSEITAQALANEKEITITGTSLPTTGVSVVLGNARCGTVTASAT
jgi:hypothetical protein